MLSESLQELLSAYVDGELAPAEYERVMSTLRDSQLARDYVTQLRGLSQQIKTLPAEVCPAQVTTRFLQNTKRRQVQIRNRRLAYVGALAAALLISFGTWWYLNQNVPANLPILNNNNLANNTTTIPQPVTTAPENIPTKPRLDQALYAQFAQETLATAYDQMNLWQDRLTGTVTWLTQADARREGKFLESQSTLLTGPVKNTGSVFKTLDAPLPLLQTPLDFNLTELQRRWSKKGLFVLDLSSKDTIKTLSRLISAGEQARLPVVIDDEVKHRLAKKLPTTFMIYLENITEEQATRWLTGLSADDHWSTTELRTDSTCLSLLLYPLDATGRTQLARSLGIQPEQLDKPDGASHGVALSYYSYRLPTSLGDEARKATARLHGPSSDRLSFVVLVRAGK